MLLFNSEISKPTVKKLDGVDHLVFPVIAAKVGVMNNLLYTEAELKKSVVAWNGEPIPVQHPYVNNVPVSANDPAFEDTMNIGKVYNAVFEDNKLKGEMWINIEKAKRLGYEEVITALENGEVMEVSTGLFSDNEASAGVFEGVSYTGIVKNIRPDHIALLPGKTGACSVAQGCGTMKVNCECEGEKPKTLIDNIKEFAQKLGIIKTNEIGFSDIRGRLFALINEANKQFGKDRMYIWVEDVFPDYFIFSINDTSYKMGYTISSDVVSLVGDSEEVVRKTNYVPVINETLVVEPEVNQKETVEEPKMALKEQMEAIINAAEPEAKAYLTELLANADKKKKELVAGLVANTKISEAEAEKLSIESLEVLANAYKKEETVPEATLTANYQAKAGAPSGGTQSKPVRKPVSFLTAK